MKARTPDETAAAIANRLAELKSTLGQMHQSLKRLTPAEFEGMIQVVQTGQFVIDANATRIIASKDPATWTAADWREFLQVLGNRPK